MALKIAIVGRMRVGKDSVANHLIERYGFKQFAFGTGIKETSKTLFPERIKEGKPRKLYQELGQKLRELNPNIWIDYCFREIAEQTNENDNIVISDLRQTNEYEELKKQGFTILKIIANPSIQSERLQQSGDNFNPEDLLHITEIEADSIPEDYLIQNDGTLEELYSKIDKLISELSE